MTTKPHEEEAAPFYVILLTYFSYAALTVIAHLRDGFGKILQPERFKYLREQNVRLFASIKSSLAAFC